MTTDFEGQFIDSEDEKQAWLLTRNTFLGSAATMTIYLVSLLQFPERDASAMSLDDIFQLVADIGPVSADWTKVAANLLHRFIAIGIPVSIFGAITCEGMIARTKSAVARKGHTIAWCIAALLLSGACLFLATCAICYLVAPVLFAWFIWTCVAIVALLTAFSLIREITIARAASKKVTRPVKSADVTS